jgi:two-component system, OmpR family, phosphate regulon sensor histidine kinase PhoR
MKSKNYFKIKMQPVTKLSIVLVLIILLPALIYTAYEFNSLNKNEKLLNDIYQQQLDAILFSVNQYTWDYINNWIEQIERDFSKSNIDSLNNVWDEVLIVAEIDTSFFHYFMVSDVEKSPELGIQILDKLKSQNNLYRRLKELKQQGYKKIETILFNDNDLNDQKIIFVFIPDYAKNYERMVYILVNSRDIINIISKKLDEIASDQFKVGIFEKSVNNPVYSNVPFQLDEIKHTKNIWIFPNYYLGISLMGESIESIMRNRFWYSLLLIIFVDLLLLIGVWLIIRTIKKEMELTKLKTDFVSNVSHELRTPLALIRMYAETLEMGRIPNDEKKQSYYQIIKGESERLTRLINNILNFSRIESGQKQYAFKKTDLNKIVNNVVEIYDFHIHNHDFEYSTNLEDKKLMISADAEAVSEAIINLIDNAIKYSSDKKDILISTGKYQDLIFLEVKDKGIGISQQNQKHIFEKFYRVSEGSTFTKKGSGLGLSLVRHIVEAHGAKITVKSELGKGSTFKIEFASKMLEE